MKRSVLLIPIICLIVLTTKGQTYSEDFGQFNSRSSYVARYNYRFSSSDIITSNGIDGNTVRTGVVTASANTHFSTGWLNVASGQTISFQHRITNASNAPVLRVWLLDLNMVPVNELLSFTYTNAAVQSSTITINQSGWYRIRFVWSAPTNVNGRGMLDNITSTIPGTPNNRSYYLTDISVSVSSNSSVYTTGQTANFNWIIENLGPDTVHQRPIIYSIPAGFYVNSLGVSNCTVDTVARKITLANLPMGSVATVQISSIARIPGNYTITGDTLAATYELGIEIDHVPSNSSSIALFSVLGASFPVEMSGFEATRTDEGILLAWETASELNSNYFEVQRSLDGRDFKALGTLPAAGTSNQQLEYQFLDTEIPPSPSYYYRIVTHFFGEAPANSKVIVVRGEPAPVVKVFPNPASDWLNIQLPADWDGTSDWVIYDGSGKIVRFGKIDASSSSMDVSSLPPGNYILRIGNHCQSIILQ